MLVLTRKPGQSVYIGEEIKITLQGIRGNQIRLGIDAPPTVRIYREEIYLQILEENQTAAILPAGSPSDLGSIAKAWKEKKNEGIDTFRATKDNSRNDEEEDD